eukprot:gene4665-5830_t
MSTGARAIVIGGTGATGQALVKELIKNNTFTHITSLGIIDKVEQVIVDMERLDDYKDLFKNHNVGFMCLGTTRRVAGSAENFRHIDYDYSTNFCRIAKEEGVGSMQLLTSRGANHKSWFLYMKVKGEIEEEVKKYSFPNLSIYRPGFLERGRTERFLENMMSKFMSGIPVETVAKGMVAQAEKDLAQPNSSPSVNYLYNDDIYRLAKN